MLSRSICNTVKAGHRWKAAVSKKYCGQVLRKLSYVFIFLIFSQFSSSAAALSSQNSNPQSRSAKRPLCHNVIVSDLLVLANSNRPIFAAQRFSPTAILSATPSSVRHFSTTNARSTESTSASTSAATPPSTSIAEAASTTGEAKPNLVRLIRYGCS